MTGIFSYFQNSSGSSMQRLEQMADKNQSGIWTVARYAMIPVVFVAGIFLERSISHLSREYKDTAIHISTVQKIEMVVLTLLLMLSLTFNYFHIAFAYEMNLITLGCGLMALVPESLTNFCSYVAKKFY